MKKCIIGLFLLFIASSLFSQKPVFFEQNDDTITFYINNIPPTDPITIVELFY